MADKSNHSHRDKENAAPIGEKLRAARVRRGRSIDDAAKALLVDVAAVQAMEVDQLDFFAAPVFARGHIRKYAVWLELNVEKTLRLYDDQFGQQSPPPLSELKAPDPMMRTQHRGRRKSNSSWMLALLLLVVLALIWFWLDRRVENEVIVAQPSSNDSGVSSLNLPMQPPEFLAEDLTEPNTDETAGGNSESLNSTAVAPEATMLIFSFSEESWLEVHDEYEAELIRTLGKPEQDQSVEIYGPVDVFLGRAAAVSVSLGGEPFEVPGAAMQGNIARFTIDPTQ